MRQHDQLGERAELPHMNEAIVNSAIEPAKYRRRPK